nr:hypothetical protein [Deinococcus peraridilitoris]
MGVADNFDMVIGPLLGALLIRSDFKTVTLVSASVYVVAFVFLILSLPKLHGTSPTGGLSGLGVVTRDRRFVLFTMLMMGYSALVVQLNVAVTLKGNALAGEAAIPWLYGMNAGLAIALQYPLLRQAERWLAPPLVLILGVSFAALGLAGMALTVSFQTLLGCVAVFALGSVWRNSWGVGRFLGCTGRT